MALRSHLETLRKLSAGAAVLACAMPAAASGQQIFDKWLTDDHSAVIAIARCGETLCGRIDAVLDPKAPVNDINNPDPRFRSNPLVGTWVLRDFVRSGPAWKEGRAYDPKAGTYYRSKLQLMANDTLKVTGCILFLCRSRYWTRAR